MVNVDSVVGEMLAQPACEALSNEDGTMLPASAAECELDAVAAAATEIRDYCFDLALEHFKELVETAPRADEVFNGTVRAVESGNFLHQRPGIREKAYVKNEVGLGGACLESKGGDDHFGIHVHLCVFQSSL